MIGEKITLCVRRARPIQNPWPQHVITDLYIIYDVNGQLYSEFTALLTSAWQVDDEGEVQDLLGVEIARNKDSVVLKRTAYIQKMVENHFPDGVPANDKDTKYPCDKSIEDLVAVAQADETTRDPESIRKYQSIFGALLYAATNTRPDIALAVSYLCRAACSMAKPTPELHLAALKPYAFSGIFIVRAILV